MVKKWLKAKGYEYEEINVEERPEMQAEAMRISGALTVPVTVITKNDDTQEVVIGFNLAKLAPAVKD
jgi:glutaredoxin